MAQSYGAEKRICNKVQNIEHTIRNWKHLVKKKKKVLFILGLEQSVSI